MSDRPSRPLVDRDNRESPSATAPSEDVSPILARVVDSCGEDAIDGFEHGIRSGGLGIAPQDDGSGSTRGSSEITDGETEQNQSATPHDPSSLSWGTGPETPLIDSIQDTGSPAEGSLVGRVVSAMHPIRLIRSVFAWTTWSIHGIFCVASLIVLLAVLTAIPVFQLIAFGYLLAVAGGLARGARFRNALPHLHQAGQIGMAAVAVFLAGLSTRLLVHWESVATLIDPGSGRATAMRLLALSAAFFATVYLMWAWVRGGRLRDYLWPQPKRFFREGWRWATWRDAPDRLWQFTAQLEMPRYFWLGMRGAVGTLVWLIPAMIIQAAFRNGETGLAGLVGFVALMFLGLIMFYLPMLQAHFAAENRLSALFAVRTIRRDFRRAPWAWWMAMLITLVVTPIPLYLLKIEATPREVTWLPCLVFVAFILPARMATGLALRRARRREEPHGWPATISRWLIRIVLMPAVVATYLLFVYISQYTSWDGLETWVQQHAILIPIPFLSGV